jgi:hypothetical protein
MIMYYNDIYEFTLYFFYDFESYQLPKCVFSRTLNYDIRIQ